MLSTLSHVEVISLTVLLSSVFRAFANWNLKSVIKMIEVCMFVSLNLHISNWLYWSVLSVF